MKAIRVFHDLADILHFEEKGNLYGKLYPGRAEGVFKTMDGYTVTARFNNIAEEAEITSIKVKGVELIEKFFPWRVTEA